MTKQAQVLEIRFQHQPSPEELAQVRQRILSLQTAWSNYEPRPFLLVTPLGVPLRAKIEGWLAERSIGIGRRITIPDWAGTSTRLYVRTYTDERLRVALAFESLWRSIALSQEAERWDLSDLRDLPRLIAEKEALRSILGTLCFRFHIPGVVLRSPDQIVRLQAIHIPDAATVADESRVLDVVLAEKE